MAYEDYCAACTYMSDCQNYGKYFCEKKGEYRYACDARCYSFCEAYGRSNYSRENMYQNSKSNMSSGCYLTTVTCKILGFPDNNYYLNTLRTFRDTKMKTNPNYIPHLIIYDTIGPLISYSLENDKHKKEMATMCFEFIKEAVTAIEENKDSLAISIYTAMTNTLADHYNINTHIITPPVIDEHDIETLGHGRIKKRTYTQNI